MMTGLLFAAGLGLLTLGAEGLVRGASNLAKRWGVSAIVVGLTVVAYGTSAPELVVSAKASLMGQADISLGNVVGSNILNVLFILGISACLSTLTVHRQIIRQEVPIMIAASCLLWAMARDKVVSRTEGTVLLLLLAAYTGWQVRQALKNGGNPGTNVPDNHPSAARATLYVAGGLIALIIGARWLLESSVTMARSIGISELVIGLTIVAAGTSLPEVATSLLAAWRKERDIAVGNVVGSNIFNILGVLGLAAIISPAGVVVAPSAWNFDIPVMLVTAVACLPIFLTGHRINRWEGALFLAYYAAYIAYIILAAQNHASLPAFSALMLAYVLPLTAVTLAVVAYRHQYAGRKAPAPGRIHP